MSDTPTEVLTGAALDRLRQAVRDMSDRMPQTAEWAEHLLAVTREATPLLSDDEQKVIDLLAEAWNLMCMVVGHDSTRTPDLAEAAAHVHALQHAVMAQAAARAYPKVYRLLGQGQLKMTP